MSCQIYEQQFEPHTEGITSEGGHFIIDKFSGGDTQLSVFILKPYDTFLKKMSVTDRRGNLYNTMVDNMANFHIFSIYNVPFESVSVVPGAGCPPLGLGEFGIYSIIFRSRTLV